MSLDKTQTEYTEYRLQYDYICIFILKDVIENVVFSNKNLVQKLFY